jgi:hypothetical protein
MKKQLSPKQREELLTALKDRFEKNMSRIVLLSAGSLLTIPHTQFAAPRMRNRALNFEQA